MIDKNNTESTSSVSTIFLRACSFRNTFDFKICKVFHYEYELNIFMLKIYFVSFFLKC